MTHQNLYRVGRTGLFILITSLLLSACAQTSVVDSWRTEKPVAVKVEKVAVIAMLPEALMRKAVEIDVAKKLAQDVAVALEFDGPFFGNREGGFVVSAGSHQEY